MVMAIGGGVIGKRLEKEREHDVMKGRLEHGN